MFEAVSSGAVGVVKAVAAIMACLIAFMAMFAFADACVMWFLSIVGLENCGLAAVFGYALWPLAFIMGVDGEDCRVVSNLIGMKMFVNEFVAYAHMGRMIDLRNALVANGTFDFYRNGSMALESKQEMIWNVCD
jgi:pyrimidine nucleoside transport protein